MIAIQDEIAEFRKWLDMAIRDKDAKTTLRLRRRIAILEAEERGWWRSLERIEKSKSSCNS